MKTFTLYMSYFPFLYAYRFRTLRQQPSTNSAGYCANAASTQTASGLHSSSGVGRCSTPRCVTWCSTCIRTTRFSKTTASTTSPMRSESIMHTPPWPQTTRRSSLCSGWRQPTGRSICFRHRKSYFYFKKEFIFMHWNLFVCLDFRNSSELYDWVGTINSIAAMFSSPPLPGGIGSSKTFQRPLLPVSKTRYTLQEQFEYHRKHIKQLQGDLSKLEQSTNGASHLHIKDSEKSFFDKDKYNYLQFEVGLTIPIAILWTHLFTSLFTILDSTIHSLR